MARKRFAAEIDDSPTAGEIGIKRTSTIRTLENHELKPLRN